MNGPRTYKIQGAMALAALLLLPACSPRKSIPSDPPEVRTEAMVRGEAAKKAAKPAPGQEPKAAVVEVKEAVVVPTEAKAAEAKAAEVKAAEVKAAAEMKAAAATQAKPVESAAAKTAEAKTVVAKAAEVKADDGKTVEQAMAAVQQNATTKSATAVAAAQQNATAASAAAPVQPADQTAAQAAAQSDQQNATQSAPRQAMVQIASFSTEKNAEAALAWLKDKGYADARVVRVEQGSGVYHRVQAGPFQDLASARKALEELKAVWPQAFIPAD